MAPQTVTFRVEVIDGYRLGRLKVPATQAADWLNFLVTPHYRADIVSAEQDGDRLSLYFEASEGLYTYLENKLMAGLKMAA
ncbi:hypothetical protein PN498_12730 [Oscillatoria sp. CS-180]|uniref:hypothetical protein n=1 Tax=Oscillatoria sp. CS-180 TaxID=3021720 RepID=UPI00232B2B1C|nr:hypothetical protein [Oscillatoria sp. CS-180]MDB9526857.1 hypothetical protein [Oscillatoria sp. CS-180]